jgi:putative addiction module component (TIGR02574 family)
MPDSTQPFDYSRLSVAERILLVQEIWDSLVPDAEQVGISNEQKQELARRWKAFQSGEMAASPWPEVKRRLLHK